MIAFDHRKWALTKIYCCGDPRVKFNVNLEKSSSAAVYEYFSNKLASMILPDVSVCVCVCIVNPCIFGKGLVYLLLKIKSS